MTASQQIYIDSPEPRRRGGGVSRATDVGGNRTRAATVTSNQKSAPPSRPSGASFRRFFRKGTDRRLPEGQAPKAKRLRARPVLRRRRTSTAGEPRHVIAEHRANPDRTGARSTPDSAAFAPRTPFTRGRPASQPSTEQELHQSFVCTTGHHSNGPPTRNPTTGKFRAKQYRAGLLAAKPPQVRQSDAIRRSPRAPGLREC